MIKNIFILACLVLSIFTIYRIMPKHNYSIFGFGEGAIMLDTITGEAWVLETQQLTSSLHKGHPLDCDEDFCGPKGIRYYWIPTGIRSCYGSLAFGRTPEEAQKIDEKSLLDWGRKLSNN